MTSSNTLKKIISLGASLLLAVGGSLAASAPAQATAYSNASISSGGSSVGGNRISVGVSGCTFASTPTSLTSQQIADFTVLIGGTPVTPSSIETQVSFISLTMPSNLPAGALLSVAYQQSSAPITCSNGVDTVGSFSAVTLQLESAPALTPDSTPATVGSTTATFNFVSDKAVSFVWTLRLASAGAPSNFINRSTWTSGAGDLQTGTGNAIMNLPKSVSLTGLSGSTAYKVYILGATMQGIQSNALEIAFTTLTAQNNNQNLSGPTQLVSPTIAVSGNNAVVTSGIYSSGTIMPNWEYCLTAKAAVTTVGAMPAADCGPLFLTLGGGSNYSNVANGLTLDLTATYYARPLNSMSSALSAVSLAGKFVRYHEYVNNSFFTATVPAAAGATTSTDSTDVTDPVTEDKRPLPVWASNIVKSIPTLTKSLHTTGGSVALTDGDFADLKSVTIGGKAVSFKLESTGNVSIPVPAGEAGKTADIVIVFAGGTMTVQEGIRYVAPTDVSKVTERPIAISAGAKKLTEAVADQIRQAAFANPKNTNISCVAYAASKTAAAKSAAMLTAVQACGIATKANPGLKASEITVIVNKAKAKKQAVGIKVYKQN